MSIKKIIVSSIIALLPFTSIQAGTVGRIIRFGLGAGCAIGSICSYQAGKDLWHNEGIGAAACFISQTNKKDLPDYLKPYSGLRKPSYNFARLLYGSPATFSGAVRSAASVFRNLRDGDNAINPENAGLCIFHTALTPILTILATYLILRAVISR